MKNASSWFVLLLTVVVLTACSQSGVLVKNARWETELSGISNDPSSQLPTKHFPSEGNLFLLVEADIPLGQSTELSTKDIKVVTGDGQSHPAVGTGPPYMMGEVGFGFEEGGTHHVGFVFSIPEETKGGSFSFVYKDGPPVPFEVMPPSE